MNNPISLFEKWRLDTIPQVGFTPEIRELLAMAFEGGRQSVAEKQDDIEKQLDYAHARGFKEGAENAYKKMEHPTQEPVALIRHENGNFSPAPSWQSLSDDEIENILDNSVYCEVDAEPFARAIEQALKEKNHGDTE